MIITAIDTVTGQRWSYNVVGGKVMDSAKAGMAGGTPELKVQPVDQSIPECGAKMPGTSFPVYCTRKQGHYGKHGAVASDGIMQWEGGKR